MTPTLPRPLAIAQRKILLGGSAHADPQHVGARVVDRGDDLGCFAVLEIAVAVAGNRQSRIDQAYVANGLLNDVRRSAQQIEARTAGFREPRHVVEQVGRGHAFRQRRPAPQPRGKHEWRAVGVNKIGRQEQPAQRRVARAH